MIKFIEEPKDEDPHPIYQCGPIPVIAHGIPNPRGRAGTVPTERLRAKSGDPFRAPRGTDIHGGLTGLLSSIELSLFERGDGGDRFLEILDFSGAGIATAPVLGAVSKAEDDLGLSPDLRQADSVTATVFDVTSLNIGVRAGHALAFRLTSPRVLVSPTKLYAIKTSVFTDTYVGGAYFVDTTALAGDAAFKITISSVPLPAGPVLLGTALAVIPTLRRRKQTRS